MRRQVEIPDVLYHVTKETNLDSIIKNGLIPHKEKGHCYTEELGDEDRYGVYLTSDYKALASIDPDIATGRHLENYIVVLINVEGIKADLKPDIAYDMEGVFTEKDIEEGLYDQFAWIYNKPLEANRILSIELLEDIRRNK